MMRDVDEGGSMHAIPFSAEPFGLGWIEKTTRPAACELRVYAE